MKLEPILSHICVVFCGLFIVLLILDRYNPVMDYIGNEISTGLLFFFCLAALTLSILVIARNRRSERERRMRRGKGRSFR